MNLTIHPVDSVIIATYLVAIVGIGLWSSRGHTSTSGEYFLAGRSLSWGLIGMAMFATNISTVHLVGLAADGYASGLAIGNFEWMATFCLMVLSFVFAPFYFRNRVATLPDYIERRFSASSRTVLAIMAVVAALFIHIGMSLYAGCAIMEQFFGVNLLASIAIMSIATCIYTIVGGLKAVVVTEAIQTVILLVGAVSITALGVWRLPEVGVDSFADLRAALRPGQLNMIHREGEFSWYAVLLGYPVLGIWYWCADQTIVQRVLGARSERDAQLGPLFAGSLKILPVFLMVFPGVLAYALFREQIGDNPNQALPVLVNQLAPVGLKGLIAAGLLAALMSSIAGALNSAASLVCIDIVQKHRPEVSERTLLLIGRVTTCVVMVLAMAWSTQGGRFESVFKGLNAMIACLAPPITVVFLWGVCWRRGTQQAAFVTLVSGFALGVLTFSLDFPPSCQALLSLFHAGSSPVYEASTSGFRLITDGWGIPFLMQAWWLFAICSAIFVLMSFFTPHPRPEQLEGLCWSLNKAATLRPIEGITDPRLCGVALFSVMVVLYALFA